MRHFLFGTETSWEIFGWHLAVLLAFVSGWFVARDWHKPTRISLDLASAAAEKLLEVARQEAMKLVDEASQPQKMP
jgi:hypothetical protein